MTAAHLLTQQTRGQHVQRHRAKLRLVRLLYERNWGKQRIVDLFCVIDWMMQLPPALEKQLMDEIDELEEQRCMPYMNPWERRGREQGRQAALSEVVEAQLEKRFGQLPQVVRDKLHEASSAELQEWATALIDAPNLDFVFSTH